MKKIGEIEKKKKKIEIEIRKWNVQFMKSDFETEILFFMFFWLLKSRQNGNSDEFSEQFNKFANYNTISVVQRVPRNFHEFFIFLKKVIKMKSGLVFTYQKLWQIGAGEFIDLDQPLL